jgi:hypothetical protein
MMTQHEKASLSTNKPQAEGRGQARTFNLRQVEFIFSMKASKTSMNGNCHRLDSTQMIARASVKITLDGCVSDELPAPALYIRFE